MKNYLFKILRYSGIVFLFREVIQRYFATIIVMHNPSKETFLLMAHFISKHYNIITLREYIDLIKENNRIPIKTMIITLDDGFKENANLIEDIVKYKIKSTIFICSQIADTCRHFWWTKYFGNHKISDLKELSSDKRKSIFKQFDFLPEKEFSEISRQALNYQEIQRLVGCNLVDFQAHTRFHPILPKCDYNEAFDEIKTCRIELEKDFNLDIFALAYPNGSYSNREIEFAKKSGYLCAVTTEPGFNSVETDLFKLRRIGIPNTASLDEIIVRTSGLWGGVLKVRNKLRN